MLPIDVAARLGYVRSFMTTKSNHSLQAFIEAWRPRVEAALDAHLPRMDHPGRRLSEAMRYSVEAGGKRMRPLLLLAAGHAVRDDPPRDALLRAAASIEMLHTYSLIHDDLPAMDNDDLRRGRPTCHKRFDEPTAILAGDALNTHAFAVLASIDDVPAERVLAAVRALAHGAGPFGMVVGQQADMDLQGRPFDAESLRFVHTHKTARLLAASAVMGGLLAGGDVRQVAALEAFGLSLGLAFQVVDDLLDVESDAATLGKTVGKDAAAGKATYPALLGLEATHRLADDLAQQARVALDDVALHTDLLLAILDYVVDRDR